MSASGQKRTFTTGADSQTESSRQKPGMKSKWNRAFIAHRTEAN
ncbi:hypothetical protein WAB97_011535 [Stenotrophomonas maltophilia]|nr:hypothetical protein [Stenotrophomonas maltophilia]